MTTQNMFNIIDIPIYRLDRKKREQEEVYEKEKLFKYFSRGKEVDEYWTREKTDAWYDQQYRRDRLYNDIVWYIRIETSWWGKIYGDVRFVTAKHLRKNGKKNFQYQGKLFEIRVDETDTNDKILQYLLNELKYQQKKYFKKRYFYLDYLQKIWKYIDWRKLLFDV